MPLTDAPTCHDDLAAPNRPYYSTNRGGRLCLKTQLCEIAVLGAQPAPNAQTGTGYTLALTDDGAMVTLDNAGAVTVVVPADADVPFPVGAFADVCQIGAGAVTISAASGVTLLSFESKVQLAGRYGVATLQKIAANTWLLAGALA